MAKYGLKYPCFKSSDAASGIVIGEAVSANLTVNNATGELYADDVLAESVSKFANGSLAMETDKMTDSVASAIYGCTVTGNEVIYNKDDTPPEGCLAFYRDLMEDGVTYYQGVYFPRVRAAIGNDNNTTRGSSITFGTENTTFTVMADDDGNWRRTKRFSTEADAISYVQTKCTITTT